MSRHTNAEERMKSFYDELGVKKNATQQDIKRAYREKAASIHPDRGGNGEKMAELNRAYATLKDPQRRIAYDTTGKEPPISNIESVALSLLAEKFLELITKDVRSEMLEHIRYSITEELQKLKLAEATAISARANLKSRRNDIYTNAANGRNLWRDLIDTQLDQVAMVLKNIEHERAVRQHALKVLADYGENQNLSMITFFGGATTTTTGAW